MNNDSSSFDPFANDPELEAMAREFRKVLRAEQEELEEISSETLESEIDITFAFLELLWNGARTRVAIGERFFEGTVTHVGKDLVQMSTTPGSFVDIHIPFVNSVFIVEVYKDKGRPIYQRDPRTFIARMRELASMPKQEVEIGAQGTDGISGILSMVRSDHLVITSRDKRQWLVPIDNIGYCIVRSKGY